MLSGIGIIGIDSDSYTAAEKLKLAGIEDNATADQTKTEIDNLALDHASSSNKDYANAGHTGFANADTETGENNNIKSMTGLDDGGIPLVKVNGATSYPESGEQAFLDADRTKLDNIETGATADQTNSEIKIAYESNLDTNVYTDTEKSKLSGIASNAEVNVQVDWNASSGDSQILNKPSIPIQYSDLSGIIDCGVI